MSGPLGGRAGRTAVRDRGSGRGPANRTPRILDSAWARDKVAFRTMAENGP
ncbi:hypothetical protein F750_5686 [Streptomyces sp. PAMC 26508]|nr:hypothetical protein F750_5686 [Streptomyces sp. PAMC 26508]